MTEVWTVHRVDGNHLIFVYDNEAAAASWTNGDMEKHYYYEHHEVSS